MSRNAARKLYWQAYANRAGFLRLISGLWRYHGLFDAQANKESGLGSRTG